MKTKCMILMAFGLFMGACSPKTAPVAEAKKEMSSEAAEGKAIYERSCGKCHQLYAPNAYTLQQWAPILERMQKKAKLADSDMLKINAYLASN